MADTYDWSGRSIVPADPKWNGNQRRWQAHRSGNLYALTIQNRSMNHTFTVHQYGKNAWQASLRYYRGFDSQGKSSRGTWIWQCTKVIDAKILQDNS